MGRNTLRVADPPVKARWFAQIPPWEVAVSCTPNRLRCPLCGRESAKRAEPGFSHAGAGGAA
eukprot:14512618-Alexandrium_andersonii.AAC.1